MCRFFLFLVGDERQTVRLYLTSFSQRQPLFCVMPNETVTDSPARTTEEVRQVGKKQTKKHVITKLPACNDLCKNSMTTSALSRVISHAAWSYLTRIKCWKLKQLVILRRAGLSDVFSRRIKKEMGMFLMTKQIQAMGIDQKRP